MLTEEILFNRKLDKLIKASKEKQILYSETSLSGEVPCCYTFGIDNSTGDIYYKNDAGNWELVPATAGVGTVTNFSAGDLSPLFTTSEATTTSTPALTFAQVSQSQNLLFASPNGSAGNPTFRALVAGDLPATSPYTWQQVLTAGSTLTGNNTIATAGFNFTFDNVGVFRVNKSSIPRLYVDGTSSIVSSPDGNSTVTVGNNNINIAPDGLGHGIVVTSTSTYVGNLANSATQDRLVGQISASSILGYLTLDANLNITTGVLGINTIPVSKGGTGNTATATNTYIAVGDGTKYVPTDPTTITTLPYVPIVSGAGIARNIINATSNQPSSFTAVAGNAYIVGGGAVAAYTITLPASPVDGDLIKLYYPASGGGTWDTNTAYTKLDGTTSTSITVASMTELQWDDANSVWRAVINL